MGIILETFNLTKNYNGLKAVNDVSLKIEEGEIYGLIGKNGAGKTTLIRLLCNLIEPNNGNYTIFGIDPKSKEASLITNKMSAIVEEPSIYLNFTGYENMILQSKLCNATKEDCDLLLKKVRLYNVAHTKKKAKDYSLGMRQRLGIAIALLSKPKLLILDEPMNGLDPEGIKDMRELLLDINKEGVTILISSHLLDELSKVATKYGIMHRGKIIKEVSIHDIVESSTKIYEYTLTTFEGVKDVLTKIGVTNYNLLEGTKLEIKEEVNFATLVTELDLAGIKILAMHEKKSSVEDYFLNIVGGKNNA